MPSSIFYCLLNYSPPSEYHPPKSTNNYLSSPQLQLTHLKILQITLDQSHNYQYPTSNQLNFIQLNKITINSDKKTKNKKQIINHKTPSLILIISITKKLNHTLTLNNIITTMQPILYLLLSIILIHSHTRIVQVTSNNIQLVLQSVGQLHLLLHNPKCQHSRQYATKFIEIKYTNNTLGITDCSQETLLCNHLNTKTYPTLILLSNHSLQILDQHLFLLREGLLQNDDPKIMHKNILNRLKGEKRWATIVLQQEQMPIIDKIQNSHQKGVYYIKNPSSLHSALSSIVGNQLGCWMLSRQQNTIHRYFCGTGYRSDQLSKYLQSFKKGKLQRHTFTKDRNSSYINHAELQQIVKDLGRKSNTCKLIYFYSKECEHCSIKDYHNIKTVLAGIKTQVQYEVQIFDADAQEIPTGLKIQRLPEMIEFCNGKSYYFGDVFTLKNIRSFLEEKKTVYVNEPIQKQKQTSQL